MKTKEEAFEEYINSKPKGFLGRKYVEQEFLKGWDAATANHDQEMVEFAEWILIEGFEKYQDNGNCWWGKFRDDKDYSTVDLLTKFRQSK